MDSLIVEYLLEEGRLLQLYSKGNSAEDIKEQVILNNEIIKRSFQKVFTVTGINGPIIHLEAKDKSYFNGFYSIKKNRPIIGKEYLALFNSDNVIHHLQELNR